jgi:hypothetical protein
MGAFIVECGTCGRLLNPGGIGGHWTFVHPGVDQLAFYRIGSPADAVSFWDDSINAWKAIEAQERL